MVSQLLRGRQSSFFFHCQNRIWMGRVCLWWMLLIHTIDSFQVRGASFYSSGTKKIQLLLIEIYTKIIMESLSNMPPIEEKRGKQKQNLSTSTPQITWKLPNTKITSTQNPEFSSLSEAQAELCMSTELVLQLPARLSQTFFLCSPPPLFLSPSVLFHFHSQLEDKYNLTYRKMGI